MNFSWLYKETKISGGPQGSHGGTTFGNSGARNGLAQHRTGAVERQRGLHCAVELNRLMMMMMMMECTSVSCWLFYHRKHKLLAIAQPQANTHNSQNSLSTNNLHQIIFMRNFCTPHASHYVSQTYLHQTIKFNIFTIAFTQHWFVKKQVIFWNFFHLTFIHKPKHFA